MYLYIYIYVYIYIISLLALLLSSPQGLKEKALKALNPHQAVNHFPGLTPNPYLSVYVLSLPHTGATETPASRRYLGGSPAVALTSRRSGALGCARARLPA